MRGRVGIGVPEHAAKVLLLLRKLLDARMRCFSSHYSCKYRQASKNKFQIRTTVSVTTLIPYHRTLGLTLVTSRHYSIESAKNSGHQSHHRHATIKIHEKYRTLAPHDSRHGEEQVFTGLDLFVQYDTLGSCSLISVSTTSNIMHTFHGNAYRISDTSARRYNCSSSTGSDADSNVLSGESSDIEMLALQAPAVRPAKLPT